MSDITFAVRVEPLNNNPSGVLDIVSVAAAAVDCVSRDGRPMIFVVESVELLVEADDTVDSVVRRFRDGQDFIRKAVAEGRVRMCSGVDGSIEPHPVPTGR